VEAMLYTLIFLVLGGAVYAGLGTARKR